MSFQEYLNSILLKTGKSPNELVEIAKQKGLLKPGTRQLQIEEWLMHDFKLSKEKAGAIYAIFKSRHTIISRPRKK